MREQNEPCEKHVNEKQIRAYVEKAKENKNTAERRKELSEPFSGEVSMR